jgi:thiopeptide-type bacteriocin biosynthesis protein
VLRSKKLNKRILPRLTTAHNFTNSSLPIYQFLCDLQFQQKPIIVIWDWGLLKNEKHLPRVQYKNVIVQKAYWKIQENDLKDLPSEVDLYSIFFKELRTKLSIPTKVLIVENDNTLLIDFETTDGLLLFISKLKTKKNLVLEEFLFNIKNCIVKDTNNNFYTNEIIIPLISKVKPKTRNEVLKKDFLTKRHFEPYSEWLYFKIYCGYKSAEELLKTIVLAFIIEGIEKKLFDKFFFIRYNDESPHFRIRFYNTNLKKQKILFGTFQAIFKEQLKNNIVSKIIIDTYKREIERYGDEFIELCESIFYADSIAVLEFISLLDGVESEKYRMLFALKGIDMLLNDFGINIEIKIQIISGLNISFFHEFGSSPILQKQLNEKYREHQKFISTHLQSDNDVLNGIKDAVEVFEKRSFNIKSINGFYDIELKTKT